MQLVDIGVNLTSGQFRRDLPSVLRRAAHAGVETMVITGTSVQESRRALQLAARHKDSAGVALYATVGVHPHDAKDFDDHSTIEEMRAIINGKDGALALAVGECGLDFNRDYSPRDAQIRAFRAQVALACELQMPLFVHEREAHEALVEVLNPFVEAGTLPLTVIHCFTGQERELRRYLDMGFYIGLTGFICMEPRGLAVRDMVPLIPMDRLMIETDAPFMYPYSSSGTKKRARCEPKDLVAVVQTLARCYGVSDDEIARVTTANARRFFRLDSRQTSSAVETKVAAKSKAERQTNNLDDVNGAIVLDGGEGEGGGQVLRVATALCAVMHNVVRVHSIRANRKAPGLRNQHVGTIELVAALSSGGVLSGALLNSTDLTFDARSALLDDGGAGGGGADFKSTSRTGGSVSLMLQGALPVLAFRRTPTQLTLGGGTHVSFSPTMDFMQVPLRALLERFGLAYDVEVVKRMFFPGSDPAGEVKVSISYPANVSTLQAISITEASTIISRVFIRVTAFGVSATEQLANRYGDSMKTAVKENFSNGEHDIPIDVDCIVEATPASLKKKIHRGKKSKEKTAVSALIMLETATGGLLSVDRTVGPSEIGSQYLAEQMLSKLVGYLQSGACVDEHLADNAVVFMALARGTSRLRVPCKDQLSSQHLETALEIAARVSGATYRLYDEGTSVILEVDGVGVRCLPT